MLTAYVAFIAFFIVNLLLGSISKRYRKVLETSVGDAVFNTAGFIIGWIIIPIVNKILFLFTDRFYRKAVIKAYKKDIHGSYKVKLTDMEHQIYLLESDRNKLRNEHMSKTDNSEEAYWAGAKYGYSLAEKNKKKATTPAKNLNEAQLFTLRQIGAGNKTVSGLVAAYLEDNGYIKLVWENEAAGKSHYEITKTGARYLKTAYGGHSWEQVHGDD